MTEETAIKNAVEGGYDFKIGEIIKEAWQKTKGIKAAFWGGFLFNFFIGMVIIGIFVTAMFIPDLVNHLGFASGKMNLGLKIVGLVIFFTLAIVALFICIPLFAGLLMLSVRHVAGLPVRAKMIFRFYASKYQLLFALFLYQLIANVPSSIINGIASHMSMYLAHLSSIFLILAGILITAGILFAFCLSIYFYISYILYVPLIIDRKLNAWRALETSRRAIRYHWFKVLGLMIVMTLILLISIIPLGIALIWTMPMMNNTMAILYRTIFGVQTDI